jgi:hypothetical protein
MPLQDLNPNPNKRVVGKLRLRPRGHRIGRFPVCYVYVETDGLLCAEIV